MNISDQRIIKDFGERFRKSIRRAIRHFDSQQQPLLSVFKTAIVEIFEHFIPIQNEQLEKEIIQLCYHKYASKLEDFNYKFVLLSLDYLLSNSPDRIKFSPEVNYKYVAIIYIEQLKRYFQENPRKSLDTLYLKLASLKSEKEQEDEQEGFFDAHDDEDSQQEGQQNTKSISQNQTLHDPSLQLVSKKDLQAKEDFIKQLTDRLNQRERNLIEITNGYMKDLQLLREQLFRKDNSQEEYYQAKYMDITEILDPKLRQLLNLHIDEIKLQFELKTRELNKIADALKGEIKSLKLQNTYLTNLTKTMDTPFDMISKAFRLEQDPYKLWKIIQDLKGNYYFKEVFENQKPSYGINYREVNNLMMTSKAYEREYQLHKQQLQDSMVVFYNNSLQQIQEIRKDLVQKEEELESQKMITQNIRDQVASEIQQVMQQLADEQAKESKQASNLFDYSSVELSETVFITVKCCSRNRFFQIKNDVQDLGDACKSILKIHSIIFDSLNNSKRTFIQ